MESHLEHSVIDLNWIRLDSCSYLQTGTWLQAKSLSSGSTDSVKQRIKEQ